MEAGKSDSFRLLSECPLPTEVGDCMLRIYGDGTCTPWPVCVFGEVHGKSAVSVRLHDACMTSELFASVKCDCALQLRLAQSQLAASSGVLVCSRVHEAGLVLTIGLGRTAALLAAASAFTLCTRATSPAQVYSPQEGRGIGLAAKVAAYNLQARRQLSPQPRSPAPDHPCPPRPPLPPSPPLARQPTGPLTGPCHPASHAPQARDGLDTVDANRALGLPDEARNYDVVPFILRDLGVGSIRLLTNNPFKIDSLRALGVQVDGNEECQVCDDELSDVCRFYLSTKATRMNHMLSTPAHGAPQPTGQPTAPQPAAPQPAAEQLGQLDAAPPAQHTPPAPPPPQQTPPTQGWLRSVGVAVGLLSI